MSQLLWFLFSSGGAVILFVVAALWLVVSPRGAARRFMLAVALFYLAASTYIVPRTVHGLATAGTRPLTREAVPPGRVAIVLLGSGAHQVRDWSGNRYAVLDLFAASRVLEAARLFRLLDADYIISTGGLLEPRERLKESGIAMADALVDLGIPRDRVVVESRSKTTQGNAEEVKPLLAARPVEHVVLVTSQIHMRRAAGAFRAEGIPVILGVALDEARVGTWWETILPTDKGLEESAMVAHELLGLAMYAARGWYRP